MWKCVSPAVGGMSAVSNAKQGLKPNSTLEPAPASSRYALPRFPPLIHLSDSTRTLGDPGQTSCRGNRQNSIFFNRERRGRRA